MLVFQVHGGIIEFRVPAISYKIGRKPPICMAHFPPLGSVTLVTKSARGFSIRPIFQDATLASIPRTKRRSRHAAARQKFHRHRCHDGDIERFHGSTRRCAGICSLPLSLSFCLWSLSLFHLLLFVLPSYVSRRDEGGAKHIKKLRWLKSELRTSSILKSETKSTRLPTYLENVHLPPQSLPPFSPSVASTNHDSIFDLAKTSSPAAWKDGRRHTKKGSCEPRRMEKPNRRLGRLPVLVRYSSNGRREVALPLDKGGLAGVVSAPKEANTRYIHGPADPSSPFILFLLLSLSLSLSLYPSSLFVSSFAFA